MLGIFLLFTLPRQFTSWLHTLNDSGNSRPDISPEFQKPISNWLLDSSCPVGKSNLFSPEIYLSNHNFFFFFFLVFLGLYPQHMEVPRLGVELELQLLAYTTAIATQDLSWVCDLHYNSQQRQILNSLSKASDWALVLMDTSWVHYHWATMGTPTHNILIAYFSF